MRTVSPSSLGIMWEGTPVEGSDFTVQQHITMNLERPRWN